MKKTSTILAILLALLVFTGCHKDKEFGNEKPQISEVEVSPALNHADFTWKVEYPGNFQTGIEISDNETLDNSRTVEGSKAKDAETYKAIVDRLEPSTTYYYRIVVWNKMSRREGEVKSFSTLTHDPEPDVYTITVSANPVEGGTVTGGSEYIADSTCIVTATANEGYTFVNWTENDAQVSTDANYTFTVNGNRTLVAHFTELQADEFNINVSANPLNGGTVTGGGAYLQGQSCTVTATANTGYTFSNWTENGNTISTNASYTFMVTNSRHLVANFSTSDPLGWANGVSITVLMEDGNSPLGAVVSFLNHDSQEQQNYPMAPITIDASGFYTWDSFRKGNYQITISKSGYETIIDEVAIGEDGFEMSYTLPSNTYTISVSANPGGGGSVSGGGTYTYGQSCTVTATANTGYTFSNWIENGSTVSTNASYTFTVNGNRTLVANFTAKPQAPQGAIDGLFTINDNGDQVYFSKGNLQYIGSASTPYWKFADNQWDVLGTTTGQNSTNQNVDRDLFGWGTSGYHDSSDPYNVNYQPWSTSMETVNQTYNFYGYGPSTNMPSPNLTGSSAQYDWGVHNAISNGGDQAGQWRTLTGEYLGGWYYVFNTRSTTSGIRYAKAQVNGVNGVILLPDNWSASTYSLSNTNQSGVSFSSNVISASQWNTLENAGAVFLPAAGSREWSFVNNVGSDANYWSVSYSGSNRACSVNFSDSNLTFYNERYYGCSVRLVCPAE